MRFMVYEGAMQVDTFLKFLKRLIKDHDRRRTRVFRFGVVGVKQTSDLLRIHLDGFVGIGGVRTLAFLFHNGALEKSLFDHLCHTIVPHLDFFNRSGYSVWQNNPEKSHFSILRLYCQYDRLTEKGKQSIMKLQAIRGDITVLTVDAIVNAANCSLLGAAEWMARFTGPPGRNCWRPAGNSTDAEPEKPG